MAQCAVSGEHFEIEPDDLEFYRKMDVPPPRLSPVERMRRRLAFRHGGKLHQAVCGLTGKKIISMYSPASGLVLYEQSAWWSDLWSGESYARDFDFSRPFFPQFAELFAAVPHLSLVTTNCENSYYTNQSLNQKNCYLTFGATNNEDCLYGHIINSCKDTLDSLSVTSCELCYEGIASNGCYDCIGFRYSKSCVDCMLIEDCQSCESCLACYGLRGKKFHVLNRPVGKDAFLEIKSELRRGYFRGLEAWSAQFEDLKRGSPRLYAHLYNCEDSSGDMVFNCKSCLHCFETRDAEHCKYLAYSPFSLESYDCNFTAPGDIRFCYDSLSILGSDLRFNAIVWHSSNVDYSMECHRSKNLFGCVGMKNAEYCIFNRQYEPEQYFRLRGRIIAKMEETGEWGEYFPATLSPHPYGDSMAQHFFPLSRDEALERGYRWREEEEGQAPVGSASSEPVPTIEDADQSILSHTFRCEASGKPFRITASELRFYRKMSLPLPRQAPDERLRRRFSFTPPFGLHKRRCAKCGCDLQSTYSAEMAPKVLCQRDFVEQIG